MVFTPSFVYIFASWFKRKQRERNPLWACWNTFSYIYWKCGSTLKKKCCLIRNLNYSLDWKAVRKVCKLVQKEKCSRMHADFPSRQTNININFWVGRGGVLYNVLRRTVQCDLRTLSFYHSMFGCNSATLTILYHVCNKSERESLRFVR